MTCGGWSRRQRGLPRPYVQAEQRRVAADARLFAGKQKGTSVCLRLKVQQTIRQSEAGRGAVLQCEWSDHEC